MTLPIATAAEVWKQTDGQAAQNTPPAYLGELCEAAAAIIASETKRDFYAALYRPHGPLGRAGRRRRLDRD